MKSTEAAFTDLEAVGNLGNSRSSINITSQSCYPLRNIGLLGMLVNIKRSLQHLEKHLFFFE